MLPSSGSRDERVTVVIPVYNGAALLGATLESVRAQSLQPAQIIVVDDGSSDDSAAVARNFGATVIAQTNAGLPAARNTGTRAARTEFVAYLDGDDLWQPHKLERQMHALDTFAKPAFAFTNFRLLNEGGIDSRYGMQNHPAFVAIAGRAVTAPYVTIAADPLRPVLADNYILPSSSIVRRADFDAIGGFNESIRTSEDTEFFLRLFALVPGLAIMEPLVLYRRHAAQISARPIALHTAFFDIQRHVLAAPQRYPAGDVRHIARAGYLVHRRIGVHYARMGKFADARAAFMASWRQRGTIGALAGIAAVTAGESLPGRAAFVIGRAAMRVIRRVQQWVYVRR